MIQTSAESLHKTKGRFDNFAEFNGFNLHDIGTVSTRDEKHEKVCCSPRMLVGLVQDVK